MKTIHTLEEVTSLDLTIFAINSHIKAYSLCWHINKALGINLKKNKGAFVSKKDKQRKLVERARYFQQLESKELIDS